MRVEIVLLCRAEEELGELFPPKSEVVLHKLSNRATVYSIQGGNPLFFDPEGRGDLLVPTVYALWKLPHLLGSFYTYSEVSPKVIVMEIRNPTNALFRE